MIGLALAPSPTATGRAGSRALVTAYVEFIRNVPLILLVYLVFYGIPSVGGFSYGPTTSFIITLSVYAGAYLVEVFRAGLEAVPRGPARCRQGDRADAVAAPRPCPAADHVPRRRCRRLSNTFVSLFKDTSVASVIAVPELTYGAQWINSNTFRIVEVYRVVTPMYLVTGYAILFAAAPARAPLRGRGAEPWTSPCSPAVPDQGPAGHAAGLGAGGRALARWWASLLGVALVYGPAPLRWLVRGYSDIIRGIPVLVLIFAVYYGLPALGSTCPASSRRWRR